MCIVKEITAGFSIHFFIFPILSRTGTKLHTYLHHIFSISQGKNPQKLFVFYNLQDEKAAIITFTFVSSWIKDVSNSTKREGKPPYFSLLQLLLPSNKIHTDFWTENLCWALPQHFSKTVLSSLTVQNTLSIKTRAEHSYVQIKAQEELREVHSQIFGMMNHIHYICKKRHCKTSNTWNTFFHTQIHKIGRH